MISSRWRGSKGRRTAAVLVAGSTIAAACLLPAATAGAAAGGGFRDVKLVSDKPGLARLTDSVDGVIDVFDHEGRFLRRLVTGGPLDDPWGMVLAPAGWGRFGGMLLVGNEEGGRINAFDPRTDEFHGTIRDEHGRAIAHEGLWGLAFGNGVFGTPRTLIYAAGIDDYAHGLIGIIRPN